MSLYMKKHTRSDYSAVINISGYSEGFSFQHSRPYLRKADLAGGVFGIDVAAGVPACRDQDNDLVSLPDSPAYSDLFDKFAIAENIADPAAMCCRMCESILDQSSLDPTLISEQIERTVCVANGLRDISLMPSISIISDYAVNGEETDVNNSCNSFAMQ